MKILWYSCILTLLSSSQLMAQTDTLYCKEVEVDSIEEYVELLTFGCSLGCAIGWSYNTTSFLSKQGENTYEPANLGDGDLTTAWVEDEDDYGIGVEILIDFDMAEQMENLNFDGIDFVNGYAKTPSVWANNSRIKTFKVWQNDAPLFYLELLDTDWPQNITFDDEHRIYLNPGDQIALEIIDIYPGKKYKDTAITEIHLYGAH